MYFLVIAAMLLVILAASEIFVNALEHLGERLKISEGVTGSLFAAVGTAMPETMVPLIALFAGTENQAVNEEIGVGAILGAPLMLVTLAMGLLAIATIRQRGPRGKFTPASVAISIFFWWPSARRPWPCLCRIISPWCALPSARCWC